MCTDWWQCVDVWPYYINAVETVVYGLAFTAASSLSSSSSSWGIYFLFGCTPRSRQTPNCEQTTRRTKNRWAKGEATTTDEKRCTMCLFSSSSSSFFSFVLFLLFNSSRFGLLFSSLLFLPLGLLFKASDEEGLGLLLCCNVLSPFLQFSNLEWMEKRVCLCVCLPDCLPSPLANHHLVNPKWMH